MVRMHCGCGFTATADGRILEANGEGWRMIERWWRRGGRQELANWFEKTPESEVSCPRFVQIDQRRYRVLASRLPIQDALTSQPVFSVVAEELLAGGDYPLEYVRRAYKLTRHEGELLNYLLLGFSHTDIGARTSLHPMEVKEMAARLKRKLSRRRDRVVRFELSGASLWS